MTQRPGPASSTAVEDYLKSIYSHDEWATADRQALTPSALANRLGLAPSSVTEMLKKLVDAGLVHHAPYGSISLTDAGRSAAVQMVRRHRLIETFLTSELGYDWHEVHDEAEHLEHAVSDRFLEAIDRVLGQPTRDPHGDPIPSADGRVEQLDAVRLDAAPPGMRGRIARVSDRHPDMLQRLRADGVGVGALVEVTVEGAFATTDAGTVRLDADCAALVWLEGADAPTEEVP